MQRTLVIANNVPVLSEIESTGGLEVFWVTNHGSVRHIYQTALNNGWSGPSYLGEGHQMVELAVGQNSDGRLEVFGVTSHGSLYHLFQTSPAGEDSWTDWEPIGAGTEVEGPVMSRYFRLPGSPRPLPGLDVDGQLELFANVRGFVTSGGISVQLIQTSAGWSGWNTIGENTGIPYSIAQNIDGRLQVFNLDSADRMQTDRQAQPAPNNGFEGWQVENSGPFIVQLEVATNGDPDDRPGRLELFGISDGGVLFHMWQGAPEDDNSWNSWVQLGQALPNSLTQITVGQNSDGRLEVFGVDSQHQPWHIWQLLTRQGGGWVGWEPLGWVPGQQPANVGYIQVGQNNDGRLEVFSRNGNDTGQHIWQDPSGAGGWSSWTPLW